MLPNNMTYTIAKYIILKIKLTTLLSLSFIRSISIHL